MSILLLSAALIAAGSASAQTGSVARSLAFLGDKPATTVVAPTSSPRMLEVKFSDGSGVRLHEGRLQGPDPVLSDIDAYLSGISAVTERVFTHSDDWLDEFRANAEARSGRALHDLTLFYRVVLPEHETVAGVCDALNAFDIVELAYPLPTVGDPSAATTAVGTSPDFENLQGYRRAAPLGVDADYGNTFSGGSGLGTTIADVETGWTDDHEDIAHRAQGNYVGLAQTFYPWDHGTAVIGELVGEDNGRGVRGLCPEAAIRLSTHQGNASSIPTAVMNAIAAVGPGDVVVLEAQCFGSQPSPFPCEFVASTFAAIQAATASGTHVFAAAGNGNNNLDQAAYGGLFDRNVRDSGAVLVGASDGSTLNRASFSNYGSRVDMHGWGFNVTTSGYGDLHSSGGVLEEYTAAFSGTSSATPIATGAGVIVNSIHRSVLGTDLDPLVLRDLLTQTGTPQNSGGHIGPRPNVRAAIDALDMPRIDISGNLIPGGQYTVTTRGPSAALYVLVFSPNRRSTPLLLSWGQMFVGAPFVRRKTGVLPASGMAMFTEGIPNDGGLSGTTFGYFQVWERYVGTNGGSFGNYAQIDIE